MQSVAKKRVGILRGGAGENYATSLRKGGDIIAYIFENLGDKYKPIDILIDKDYIWHFNGVPVNPADLIHKVDLIYNASHPSLSNILNSLSIPNIGASPFQDVLQNNKEMLREHMKKIGINMPRHIVLPARNAFSIADAGGPVYQKDFDGPRERYSIKKAKEVFQKFGSPWIVKSFPEDINMGVYLAKTFNELVQSIEDGVQHEKSILVEEFITGKIASVHCVRGFRMGDLPAQTGDLYTFPPVNVFGNISPLEKEKLTTLAKHLHSHIDAKHYSKSVFVLHPRGKIYLIHIDSMPNLKPNSHFSEVCESVGAKMHQVVEHILEKVS